ncbi:hypothetical protein F5H01DRAFT_59927 [Linnemannia elongata]|nr:hypothetical protein F5H01DRAFT_59927 [Linnemannia elongata]
MMICVYFASYCCLALFVVFFLSFYFVFRHPIASLLPLILLGRIKLCIQLEGSICLSFFLFTGFFSFFLFFFFPPVLRFFFVVNKRKKAS